MAQTAVGGVAGPARELGASSGVGDLLLLYLPPAASGLPMTLQQPVVNAGIARTHDLTAQLAAYGVVLSIVVLLESPIQMLLPTATALVVDTQSFRLVRRQEQRFDPPAEGRSRQSATGPARARRMRDVAVAKVTKFSNS